MLAAGGLVDVTCRGDESVLLRVLAVGLFAVVLTTQVVRTAVVAVYAEEQPATAAMLWPDHPEVLRTVAMAGVGNAAGRGELLPPETLRQLKQLAEADPLAPEPLLVHGAIALRTGDYRRAEDLLLQARQRDPRAAAARFLLTDLYLRTGRTHAGLVELPALGRLVPNGIGQLTPFFAAFATTPGAVPELRRVVRLYPELREPLLQELAADPKNAGLVLAIAGPTFQADEGARWQQTLIDELVKEGEYNRAHAVWTRLSGVAGDQGRMLFNPGFGQSQAPPPFNWAFASSAGGVAEPADGALRVLYFGRHDLVLATQLLLLPSGHYRLEMQVAGASSEGSQIAWTVKCLPGELELLRLPVRPQGAAASISGEFEVPSQGCRAQRLELRGVGSEFPKTADFRISGLDLKRGGS